MKLPRGKVCRQRCVPCRRSPWESLSLCVSQRNGTAILQPCTTCLSANASGTVTVSLRLLVSRFTLPLRSSSNSLASAAHRLEARHARRSSSLSSEPAILLAHGLKLSKLPQNLHRQPTRRWIADRSPQAHTLPPNEPGALRTNHSPRGETPTAPRNSTGTPVIGQRLKPGRDEACGQGKCDKMNGAKNKIKNGDPFAAQFNPTVFRV